MLQLLGLAAFAPEIDAVASDTDDARRTAANLEAVTRYANAWKAGDLPALRNCYHDDFTLHYFGKHPLAGDHVGKGASLATLADVSRRAKRSLVEIIDVMAGPRRAALVVREHFARDAEEATLLRVLVYSVNDGLLRECWVFDADQARVDHFLR